MKYKKVFLLLSTLSLIAFLLIKIFAGSDEKNVQNLNNHTFGQSAINDQNNTNNQYDKEIENIEKVIKIFESMKEDKMLVYELRRKFEKQNLFDLISNKENFKAILKSLNYGQKQKDMINENFGNQEEFFENAYKFYLYLVLSNLDESKISKLKEQEKFIKQKIYRIDPATIKALGEVLDEALKSKNDPSLNSIIQEVEKNLYQPNLSKEKKEALFSEIKKINYILNLFEDIQNNDAFRWVKQNKEEILNRLKF
ncbi:MAG: hypothetical protein ACK4GJ_04300 [bacterium]